tara:strand:+ start:67 stop:726 length:660 start_codon:yes stop_codon:yes gene_type:complete
MLVLGPIIMMVGFVTLPDFEGVVGQEYLDEVNALDFDITFVKMFIVATGVLMLFGGFFLLSQDLMANSGKLQRDLLMMSRMGFMFAFTVFYLFFALQIESIAVAQGVNDAYADDPALVDELALDAHYMAEGIWGSMPIAWGTALLLFGIAAVTGNNSPKESMEWAYGLPIIGALAMMSSFLGVGGFAAFLLAMFCAVPIGVLMLTGHLKDTGADSEESD